MTDGPVAPPPGGNELPNSGSVMPGIQSWPANRVDAPAAGPALPGPATTGPVVARGWLLAAIAALFVVSGLAGYLLNAAGRWQDHSAAMDTINLDLGTEVAALRTELAGAQTELDVVRTQLATAQERIIELADEKAQVGDEREYQRQLTEYQIRVTEAAGLVAEKLESCIVGQGQIIGLLGPASAGGTDGAAVASPPTAPALDDLRRQVETACQEATAANQNLQRELGN